MSSCRVSVLGVLCTASLLVACGGNSGSGLPGPCEIEPVPEACGAACDDTSPCADGFYCTNDDTCTADCTDVGGQCGDSEECNADGRCVAASGDDGGDTGDSAGDDDGNDCPAVEVDLTPVVPVVTLLIDQSASMNDPFPNPGDPSRWEALKTALIGPNDGANSDGVLFELESSLNMGAVLYSSLNGDSGGTCPRLVTQSTAVDNAAAIRTLLTGNEPFDDTPTGESVDAVVDAFPASDNPRVIVLATDGLPDRCDAPDAHDATSEMLTETAVQGAFSADITTFVLSVGPDVSQNHLQRVANAGQGLPLNTMQPAAADFFVALNPEELVDAFAEIVGGIRSCQIDINGSVDLDRADEGTVVLNGDTLTFETDWVMVDENTLELVGDACDTFLSADRVTLSAEFPCGGVVVD